MGLSILLYSLITGSYFGAIYLFSFFNKKAKLWINGRKKLFAGLPEKLKNCRADQKKYWFHCASVGEFEQGRPLMEALKEREPEAFIMLSFFSPSGIELHKNYSGADLITYLPADNSRNAQVWFDFIKPDAVFFIKYEFWYFFLREAHQRKIPLYLISAHFRKDQLFFGNFGSLHRKMLTFYSYIFVQDSTSEALLKTIGINKVTVSGDTRLDRVLKIKKSAAQLPYIANFKGNHKVFVCGSSWPADEKIIIRFWQKYLKSNDWKLIIAPHEIKQPDILELKVSFDKTSPTLLYSEITAQKTLDDISVLIIDNIGMLSIIYGYAAAAYIGGGFGHGIHNSLEAAVHGIPVFFGPKNKKFQEAEALKNIGQAFETNNAEALSTLMETLNYELVNENSNTYFQQEQSASKIILSKIF